MSENKSETQTEANAMKERIDELETAIENIDTLLFMSEGLDKSATPARLEDQTRRKIQEIIDSLQIDYERMLAEAITRSEIAAHEELYGGIGDK